MFFQWFLVSDFPWDFLWTVVILRRVFVDWCRCLCKPLISKSLEIKWCHLILIEQCLDYARFLGDFDFLVFFCLQFLVASGPHLPQFWYQNCILWGSDLTRLVLSTNMSNMLCTCIFCKIKNTHQVSIFILLFFSAAPCRSAWGLHFLDLHSSLMHKMSVLSTHTVPNCSWRLSKNMFLIVHFGVIHIFCVFPECLQEACFAARNLRP